MKGTPKRADRPADANPDRLRPEFQATTLSPGNAITVYAYHWSGRPFLHYHPDYELTLMKGSKGQRLVGNNSSRYVEKDLVLVGPNLPHTWMADTIPADRKTLSSISVQFTMESIGLEFLIKQELQGVHNFLKRATNGLHFTGPIVDEIEKTFETLQAATGLRRLLVFFSMLDVLSQCPQVETLTSDAYRPSVRKHERAAFEKVLTFIHGAAEDKILLRDAARQVGMSVSTFNRFFKKMTGTTFVRYVNKWRIGKACILLRETDRPVLDVCYASGFHNLAHFNRQFRLLQGTTPQAYRAVVERAGRADRSGRGRAPGEKRLPA